MSKQTSAISSNISSLFWRFINPPNGTYLNEFLRSTFFYSPIIAPVLLIAFTGLENVYEKWFSSVVISLTVSYFCIATIAFVREIGEPLVMRWRGRKVEEHSRSWWYLLSLCAMGPGLIAGFKVNTLVHKLLGYHAESADYTLGDVRIGVLIGSAISFVFFLLRSRQEARTRIQEAELKLKTLENQHLQAQISALTAQMNPHLMFNALNTVASLVPTDPEKAEDTIVKLAELYRGVLNSSQKMTHSLEAELKICKAYLAVEKARFGSRLNTSITVDAAVPAESAEVPALCIQPLVENAIKHGLSPRSGQGKIAISVRLSGDNLDIRVDDDGVGLESARRAPGRSGSGTALKNCRQRLELHYGASGELTIDGPPGGGTCVRMTFPMKKAELPC